MLPTALSALAGYKQFILCKLIPLANGKTDKIPVHPATFEVGVNPHDPANWVDAETCYTLSAATGYAPAFVLTAADPFFCLDIDGALQADNTWSQLSLGVLAALPGAAVEVSQSGTGLHVWGAYSSIQPHACKNTGLGLELYHELRFICFGRADVVGNAGTDCTAMLQTVIPQWFAGGATTLSDAEWTTAPSPDWRGPDDDAELVRRMMNSKMSTSAMFGAKASFQDLWTCNVQALARAYPSSNGQEFDASSADAALASHLAFWTGRNCARVERLMRMSGLVRDKYDREDYLPRTILKTINSDEVYKERELDIAGSPAMSQGVVGSSAPVARRINGSTFANLEAQLEIFKGCVYVRSLHQVLIPGGQLLDAQRFNASAPYNRFTYMLDEANEKTTRKAFEAFTQSQAYEWPQAEAICFRPELPPGHITDEGLVNSWWPIHTAQADGDVTPFLTHLSKLLPDQRDRDILLAYAAALVQFPGDKFQWWPLIQGTEGNGKTLLLEVLEHCIGSRYCHRPNAAEIAGGGGKFTGWLSCKVLVGFEEIRTAHKSEVLDILKPIVTNNRIEIQRKGVDQITSDNRANGLLHSNHKDAITKTAKDRRYAIFYTAQQSLDDLKRDGMTGDYFPKLYRWLRHDGGLAFLNRWLREYRIPSELNPALNNGGTAHRAPETSSTVEALQVGLGKVEQEVLEAVAECKVGFCGGWINSIELDNLLREKRLDHLLPRTKRTDMLKTLGYVHHPALYGGRATSPTSAGRRPVLYVKEGHPVSNIGDGGAITRSYESAQMMVFSKQQFIDKDAA